MPGPVFSILSWDWGDTTQSVLQEDWSGRLPHCPTVRHWSRDNMDIPAGCFFLGGGIDTWLASVVEMFTSTGFSLENLCSFTPSHTSKHTRQKAQPVVCSALLIEGRESLQFQLQNILVFVFFTFDIILYFSFSCTAQWDYTNTSQCSS